MARIPDAFLDELLARTDIVEIVGARVQLKKQGREFAACCPFHDERSPSFTVSPGKQFYHCFGCGAHGTAISFLMNYDRLEFLDAVEELAKRAGLEIPRDTRQKAANPDTQPLFNALEAAQRFFRKHLQQSAQAQAYLQDRGVDAATAEAFGIGYAPAGFSALKDALGTDERRMQLLEKAGMFSRNDRGHVYDKFRQRLMFPIHDRRGRVIAFGGRVLSSDDSPKYLNSPETPLFHKGRELYGLWQVRQANSKLQRLIVVEGYMDVVALFQHGLPEAVATLGTATTPEHAELLFRNAPDVYFCFDGDAAGRRAASRAMHSVLPRMRDGRQAFFLFLPDGEDPDSLVRKEGLTGFNQRLQEALPLSQFFFDALSADVQLHTLEGKSRLAERAKPLLAQIPEGAFADLMQARLAELTGLAARTQPVPAPRPQHSHAAATPKRSLVREVITLLLQQPKLALQAPVPYPFIGLQQRGIALLIELLDLIRQRPDIQTSSLLQIFADREEGQALHKLAMTELPGEPQTWQAEFHDALAQLEKQTLKQQRAELTIKIRETGIHSLSEAEKQLLRQMQPARD
ncbi:MAG: DNA primase [Pseudomonadota bacterium]|nr:DNA primase [Pseudomonadota bacterium]